MNPVSARLLNQQLCSPQYDTPAQLVSYFGAIQAQEYRLMRWAVAMRTRKPSESAFARDYDDGRLIRMHLLRGTWQLIAGEDYGWMMDLYSEKARKVILGWMHANGIDLTASEISRVSEVLLQTASELGSATKEDFVQALQRKDIRMDDHSLSYHIRMAELDRLLCNGKLLPMKASYSPVSEKIPHPDTKSREEALATLALKYFRSHSPATLEDYVWWSGLSLGDCRKGMSALGKALLCERIGGREFYILESCRTRGFRKGNIILLPSYDEYLIGYKSRDLVLDPQYSYRAHNNSGNFSPIVLRDGIVSGNWSPFAADPAPDFFAGSADLSAQWQEYQRYKYL